MKYSITLILICMTSAVFSQYEQVESKVYGWKEFPIGKEKVHNEQLILEGSTRDLEHIRIEAIMLLPLETSSPIWQADNEEKMVLVKKGKLTIQIGDKQKVLGPGSMAMIMPGDEFMITISGNEPATYYSLKFKARKPANMQRSDSTGGSFMVDFTELEFKPHDKGGIRNYYHGRPTAMFGFTEMHVTNLNPRIKSHEPHTHNAAELVLMISGKSEMQIGDSYYAATSGDLYYLESNVSHAIQNTGDVPCMYYAFQWE